MGTPGNVKVKDHSTELRSSQGNPSWHVEYTESKVELFGPDWKYICGSRDSSRGKDFEVIAAAMNVNGSLYAERDQLREQNEQMLEILEDLTLGAYGQAEAKARTVLAKTK